MRHLIRGFWVVACVLSVGAARACPPTFVSPLQTGVVVVSPVVPFYSPAEVVVSTPDVYAAAVVPSLTTASVVELRIAQASARRVRLLPRVGVQRTVVRSFSRGAF